jgi:hypothetical protein
MIEEFVEKVATQPLVQVSDYVPVSADTGDAPAKGAVVVIDTQDGEPNDGDVPTYVAGTPNKFKPMQGGTASMTPTRVLTGQTFLIPDNKQTLYTIPIVNEGTIAIGSNAYLVLVP